jgi:hypothetical protein
MSTAANEGLGAVDRVAVATTAPISSRRLHLGLALLALGVLWAVQCAPASAQANLPCTGDCDNLGSVTVDELVKGVNIALDILPLYRCPVLDQDFNGAVTVDELATAVNNALDGCPSGELSFDQFPVAMLSDGQETVEVTARDESGNRLDWTVESTAPDVVDAERIGDAIELTGLGVGDAAVMVTTHSELRPLRRALPVRVYDPLVLDAGEILIGYVDTFECLGPVSQIYGPVSFYRPVVPEGWHRLGMFGISTGGCPNINGKQWMITVKENPEKADPITPPLAAPTRYRGIGGFGTTGGLSTSFSAPECPAGYVPMGCIEGYPNPDDATCVREDLTVPGVGGDQFLYYWANRTAAPDNTDYDATTTYLETGAFSVPDPFHQSTRHVLAIELPLLVDTQQRTWLPRVTSFSAADNLYREPLLAKAVLVPFTAVLSGSDYAAKGVGWMVENSPFVRVERVVRWDQVFFAVNTGSVEQNHSRTFTKGISQDTSTTISHTAGVSLTVESGVSFLGTGGKISATVSYQFGYQTQHSVGQFEEESTTVSINVAPNKAAAAWREQTTIQVMLHHPGDGSFETLVSEPMYDSLSFVTDDYPD